MMHQRIDPELILDDRPERDEIIDKDEIIGLIIDLETMSPSDVFSTYFNEHQKNRK
ncbi:MAG: hypothetical protein JXA18_13460 [Chitinispirillaceae bacterium]|nr:hypothetical protein [Chitinispirillaceae bacterium]